MTISRSEQGGSDDFKQGVGESRRPVCVMLKVFFDGGARPNPGPIELCAVARGISHFAAGPAPGSNHAAEWLALLHALEVARGLGADDVVLVGDSLAIVREATAKVRSRGAAQAHLAAFQALAAQFQRVRVRHVKRAQNLAGIALERRRAGL